jgi:8-oxo-dGTP pyrophosphatase MutT (NUDIX family)
MMSGPAVSCGVLVTDGALLLLGHATGSPRWDIPKGLAEPDESDLAAARRELLEETGLAAPSAALRPLGRHAYRPGKHLALFLWRPDELPDPATLRCTSTFRRGAASLPEFDRFTLAPWSQALGMVGKSMAAVLSTLSLP